MLGWILFVIVSAALGCVLVLNRRELKRMSVFLSERDPLSNARLTVGVPTPTYENLVLAINQQLDELDTRRVVMDQERKVFQQQLTSLSHDIRTPLAGAKGYLQLAEGESGIEAAADYREKAIVRLDVVELLLDQLFAYTKATDPDLSLKSQLLKPVDVLIEVLADRFGVFEAKGWDLEWCSQGVPCMTEADPAALRRIFENLIQNVLLYGASAPVISAVGGSIVIANPIAKGYTLNPENVFDRFYRGDTARSIPGTGLGLATVKALCEAQGIAVSATCDDETFEVRLEFA